MKQIVLLCAAGLTTSLLTQYLEKIIIEKELDIQIKTASVAEVATIGKQADILVLSPQIRFNYLKVQRMFPHKATILIEEEDYKNLNASKVLEQINKEI